MLPAHLQELVDFHAPLSTLRRNHGGAVTLLTPGTNVLAVNATFLPDDPGGVDLDAVRDWHEGQGLPVLVASAQPVAGARAVGGLLVGAWAPDARSAPADVVVEQVSRLHLSEWARVLATAHGTPDWGEALARHLAVRLEGDRESVLLMAYQGGMAVGALLWRGGGSHLWGTAEARAALPLLRAAFDLGGGLRVSASADQAMALSEARPVVYSLLD